MQNFLNHIRQEKLDAQKRRYEYTKVKFLLVVGLFGIGNWKFSDPSENYLLLYLVPFVGFAIDLYVHGENFGIRRIGFFVREISNYIKIERAWEYFVDNNRDKFTQIGIHIVSGIVFFSTLFLLHFRKENLLREKFPAIHNTWILVNLFIFILFIVLSYRGYRSLYTSATPIQIDSQEPSPTEDTTQ